MNIALPVFITRYCDGTLPRPAPALLRAHAAHSLADVGHIKLCHPIQISRPP
jgi:hypothetical protein